jgi:gluconokinase
VAVQASARGAALLALEACGVIGDISEVPSERGGIVQPCAERHAIYERALARQNTLYEHMFGTALA